MATEPYRPSNGSEGDYFMIDWCDKCVRNLGDKFCPIIDATMVLDVDDPDYPKEWVEDENGPRCTSFASAGADGEGA